jgi:hypothetical protein
MNKTSFVVPSRKALPPHLKGRTSPYELPNTTILFREQPRGKCLDADFRVVGASMIEFQTQMTPGQLADVCDPNENYEPALAHSTRFRVVVDPQIQRGVKETKSGRLQQILVEANVESMMDDIQKGEFECPPLMWNLRFDEVTWVYIEDERKLVVYEGVATRPDTNHRHHAIIRKELAYRRWVQETGDEEWDGYVPERPYQLTISTDTFEGEAHKFFVLNTKGAKVSANKAYFVEAQTANPHAHTRLAKSLMDSCGILTVRNVEVVQATLSKNSAKMVGLYTIVRGLEGAFPSVPSDDGKRQELLDYVCEFLTELSAARPDEIGLLSLDQRQEARESTVADQAIMFIAYLKLAAYLRDKPNWKVAVEAFGEEYTHTDERGSAWQGDLMSRQNPLWQARGVLAPAANKPGVFRVISNRNAQTQTYEALRQIADAALARADGVSAAAAAA